MIPGGLSGNCTLSVLPREGKLRGAVAGVEHRQGRLPQRLVTVPDGLFLFPLALGLLLIYCFSDLGTNDSLQPVLDLPPAIVRQAAVGAGNVVPKEKDVEDAGYEETECGDDPDHQGEQHGEENEGLLPILLCERLHVEKELIRRGPALFCLVLPFWDQFRFQNCV